MGTRVSVVPSRVARTMNSASPSLGATTYAIHWPSLESVGKRIPFHESKSSRPRVRKPPALAAVVAGGRLAAVGCCAATSLGSAANRRRAPAARANERGDADMRGAPEGVWMLELRLRLRG